MKDEDRGDLIETAQEMVDQNHPMVKAWRDYKTTSAFRNSRHRVAYAEHVDGSLWAAFVEGWNAAENARSLSLLAKVVDEIDQFAMAHSKVEAAGADATTELRADEWAAYMNLLQVRDAAQHAIESELPHS